MTADTLRAAVEALHNGGVIAYPTESCFGLGCDPECETAVAQIVRLKQRALEQGVLLVASSESQIAAWISTEAWQYIEQPRATWPGPFTWIFPAAPDTPDWITGSRDTIAIRISAHPLVQQLCHAYGGAIVSTSANPHGQPAAISFEQTRHYFPKGIDVLLPGNIGTDARPSQIQDARTGTILRHR